ncbi:GGDEF domain-containing protein [Arthrobacter cupressi]|uniref:Diguanylate cyclase (GGDEF) domain-containing protein n=1 Tax=Arthrobacter cupressi TaxID=1045773 RepID=A0A1G8P9K6_9MICC|nr:GGDEF domain-containing protein [Arthrobacter cupressi]NYD76771.1 diguanylate cyclase (GGDEF)-like protein [Arthrobacter cupressi]SDI89174.1 diguanylate cyclase (GGDEF) domain-containing protein [Arthrobacter cupressi]
MVLDVSSLKLTLGIVALTLSILFFSSFRRTRSPYSGWWCLALGLLMAGNIMYLMTGTPQQVWANPAGNALLVAGAFSVWAGSRSLRLRPTPRWLLLSGPAFTAVSAAIENPGSDAWAGGFVYLLMMTAGMALATRELALLRTTDYQAHRELALAAGILAGYYLLRACVYTIEGPEGPVFTTYFSSAFTSMLTIVMLVTVSFSMTALSNEQLIARLNERASRDGLTGLLNHTTFMEQAAQEVRRLHNAGSVSTVILADLDNFKAINDAHGHAVGDTAIRAFAAACRAAIRHTDLAGRYGGEEFVVLLPGAGHESARVIAEAINRNLAAAEPPEGVSFPTVSYGIATTTAGDLAETIGAADGALYEAKRLGRNRIVTARLPKR